MLMIPSRAIGCLVLACAVGCARNVPSSETIPSASPAVPFHAFPSGERWSKDIALRLPHAAVLRVSCDDETGGFATLREHGKNRKIPCDDLGFGLREYAVVERSGCDVLLLHLADGGTGFSSDTLSIFNPGLFAFVSLTVGKDHSPLHEESELVLSDNAADPACAADVALLHSLKRRYGYLSADDLLARQSDPLLAFYFWGKDNLPLDPGKPLSLRYYPGPPRTPASPTATLDTGDVAYSAHFKAGVVAYEKAADRHYVVYHPADYYQWPTALAHSGAYLIMGTRYGGVAVYDEISRRLVEHETDAGDVDTLRIDGQHVLVNGTCRLPLP